MTAREEIQQLVSERAEQRCEYCGMHQSLQGATFHVEHVVPRSRGGDSSLGNLAWACPGCNLCKGDRVAAPDPQTGETISLFHPRVDDWHDHFRWADYHVVPLTPLGRTTVAALHLNHPRRIRIREAEQRFGLFPPDDRSFD